MKSAEVTRRTKETDITLKLTEGGDRSIATGIGFFDHMLTALAFYAGFGLELMCKGDLHVDAHHTVEDCGIVFGQALAAALGDKKGIERFASKFIPMDEALAFCALDISGRPFLRYDAPMPQEMIGDYPSCLTEEFFRAFAMSAGITLHLKSEYGANAHHIAEALFKAAGAALSDALRVKGDRIMSTKGMI